MLLLAFSAAYAADPVEVEGVDEQGAPSDETLPIINGEPADEDLYPMTGALIVDAVLAGRGYSYDFRALMCSSTLIAPDVVALAAHCLDEESMTYGQGSYTIAEMRWTRQADLTAYSDFYAEEKAQWPEDSVLVSDWVTHEGFSIWALDMGLSENFDVALLFLDEPVTDVPYVRLPTAEAEQALLVEGAFVDVVGWGQQTATSYGETPPAGTYAEKMWGTSVLGEVGEFEFQVGPDTANVRKCHGDSGGPTFQEVGDGAIRLVGITSHAYDNSDCNRTGGVDTRVSAYLDWIDAELRERCADGTRAWCEEEGIPTTDWVDPAEDEPADTGDLLAEDDDEEEAGGCACSSPAGASPGVFGALLGLAALRRRRA